MEKNVEKRFAGDRGDRCDDPEPCLRDNFPCGASLLLQAQIQHLLVESVKNSKSFPSLDQLLLDSSKLGISQSELHRILSQQLAKYKKLSSSPSKFSGEYEQFSGYAVGGASPSRGTDKTDAASCESELRMAELSLSLDSWKPQLTSEDNNNLASSMPELAHQSNSISSYRMKTKGNLSVRFENEEDEDEEVAGDNNNRFGKLSRHRRRRYRRDEDSDSCCSTCSSSSSSDDPTVYQLPARRQYAGGARISYVPNDTLAFAKRQQSLANRSPNKKPSTDDKNCVIS